MTAERIGEENAVATDLPTVRFMSNDGRTNLTREVGAAFGQTPMPVTVPGAPLIESYGTRRPAAAPRLPEYAIALETVRGTMLGTEDRWVLAVENGDATEILDRQDLEKALAEQEGNVVVYLRQPTEQESTILDAGRNYLSPESSLRRIEDSVNAPIALTGTVGTFAAVGGFVAIRDSIARNWPVYVSVGAMALAVGLALFARYSLKSGAINLNRIDLVQRALGSLQRRRAVRLSNVAVLLLVVALGVAPFAAFPKTDPPSSAKVSSPSGAKTATGARVQVTVTWSDLSDRATRVRAVVAQGSFSREHYADAAGGAADLTFDEDLPSTADYTVTTEAVGGDGQAFGKGFLRTFRVP